MNSSVMALCLASVMVCLGALLRAKVPFLRKMLVPASVVGGILGFIFMNVSVGYLDLDLAGANAEVFNQIVNIIFTISFIGICLSDPKKSKSNESAGKKKSGTAKGGLAMGVLWSALFSLTGGLGYFIIEIVGKPFGMGGEYGTLIPTAFCQGPGQAAAMGLVYETTYGIPNSSQVAVTFAVIGFLAAFFVGVPLAKYGMKKKIAKNTGKLTTSVEKGYFTVEEQRESLGKVTTHTGNLETLTFHFAVIGVCYLIAAYVVAPLLRLVPVLGPTMAGMMFFNGMLAAYLVKAIMKKLNIYFLVNTSLLSRITGWASDYLVVCAFMAVELAAVGVWLVPIAVESILITVLTFVVCLYFGERIGGENDFERVLGLYGTCTGTTPSGVALVRMVDPSLKTSTAVELGMMNMFMIFSAPCTIFVTLGMTGIMPVWLASVGMIVCGFIYLGLMKVFKVWNKPTFTLAKGRISDGSDDDSGLGFVKGFLVEGHDMSGLVK